MGTTKTTTNEQSERPTNDDARNAASTDGRNATADGRNATADGQNATADGQNATADGRNATADGRNAATDGRYAAADGYGNASWPSSATNASELHAITTSSADGCESSTTDDVPTTATINPGRYPQTSTSSFAISSSSTGSGRFQFWIAR